MLAAVALLRRAAACDRRDRAEMLDHVPAQSRVQVIRRPRYGCPVSEQAVR
jgi:hypothetical protein